ncbi:hypothetical protein SmJEL517_g03602 [Synchytrium microbalum]|uniref:J domain-containing protein n=1 Tax=Synchytrium microbalum TaxID=1806994 RepID=A0A507C1A7_9FUNG|nr:uncharacterized protein SmJEL517_g03602 [Synchytrium microbalum]TPX33482.1 hypothetical protein SmJEL517_g03602 [Synchytrium microbalum]
MSSNRVKLKSNEPQSIATSVCTSCKSTYEFTVPALIPSPAGTIYEVDCYKCNTTNEIPSTRIRMKGTPELPSTSSSSSNNGSNSKNGQSKSSKPFSFGGKTGTDENPVDMEYYNVLGVDSKATPAQVKKAYYQMAMKAHPDKNRDDPNADEKFKKISEAYQVLFDPQRRAHYNQYGKAAPSEAAFVDPEEFFKQQFGGDKFVDIIGEISIAKDFKEAMNVMQQSDNNGGTGATPSEGAASLLQGGMSLDERTQIRTERVNKLVTNLVDKLSLYTDAWPVNTGDPDGPIGTTEQQLSTEALDTFSQVAQLEAESLKTESYGVELLQAIGYVYSAKADQWLSRMDTDEGHLFKKVWGFSNRLNSYVKEKSHILGETVGTFRTALDLQSSFAKLQDMEKKKEERRSTRAEGDAENKEINQDEEDDGLTQEERELKTKLEYEAATKGLETLWRGSKLEVEAVLREVCDKVLGDESVPAAIRRRRADGLKALGAVFRSVKRDDGVLPGGANPLLNPMPPQ